MTKFENVLLEAIIQHQNIEVRLAWSILYDLKLWDIIPYLKESWRWN